ncbi:hypothetical protein DFH08DRAFT_1086025, partial [Mycena albidolilacea]
MNSVRVLGEKAILCPFKVRKYLLRESCAGKVSLPVLPQIIDPSNPRVSLAYGLHIQIGVRSSRELIPALFILRPQALPPTSLALVVAPVPYTPPATLDAERKEPPTRHFGPCLCPRAFYSPMPKPRMQLHLSDCIGYSSKNKRDVVSDPQHDRDRKLVSAIEDHCEPMSRAGRASVQLALLPLGSRLYSARVLHLRLRFQKHLVQVRYGRQETIMEAR